MVKKQENRFHAKHWGSPYPITRGKFFDIMRYRSETAQRLRDFQSKQCWLSYGRNNDLNFKKKKDVNKDEMYVKMKY